MLGMAFPFMCCRLLNPLFRSLPTFAKTFGGKISSTFCKVGANGFCGFDCLTC